VVEAPGSGTGESRQRWRVAFARGEPLLDLAQPEIATIWEEAFRGAALPVAMSQGQSPRPRLAFAAPLPIGMPAEHELLDAILGARVPLATVRESLSGIVPAGLRVVDLFDVWMGEPALPAALAAADYRVAVADPTSDALELASRRILATQALPRERIKGEGRTIRYDLRPLILSISVTGPTQLPGTGRAPAIGPAPDPLLRMRLRHAQDGGIGRPGEVLLALGEVLGRPVDAGTTIRERLWTADELQPV
jgi:radical SAM-linked protein